MEKKNYKYIYKHNKKKFFKNKNIGGSSFLVEDKFKDKIKDILFGLINVQQFDDTFNYIKGQYALFIYELEYKNIIKVLELCFNFNNYKRDNANINGGNKQFTDNSNDNNVSTTEEFKIRFQSLENILKTNSDSSLKNVLLPLFQIISKIILDLEYYDFQNVNGNMRMNFENIVKNKKNNKDYMYKLIFKDSNLSFDPIPIEKNKQTNKEIVKKKINIAYIIFLLVVLYYIYFNIDSIADDALAYISTPNSYLLNVIKQAVKKSMDAILETSNALIKSSNVDDIGKFILMEFVQSITYLGQTFVENNLKHKLIDEFGNPIQGGTRRWATKRREKRKY